MQGSKPATSDRSSASRPAYYSTLDGFRGIAALYVVLRHAIDIFHFQAPPGTAVGVDLFLLLSGFVLANAVEERFRNGAMSAGQFIAARVERLYPLYLLGLAFGAGANLLASLATHGASMTLRAVGGATALGLVFLPAPFDHDGNIFPLNVPCWSLFFQLFVNIAYAFTFRLLTTRVLAALVAASGAIFSVLVVQHHSCDLGPWFSQLPAGITRSVLSFCLGVLLVRVRFKVPPVPAPLVLLVGAALILTPTPLAWRPLHDLAVIFVASPLLVSFGAAARPGPRLDRLCRSLGSISFALYTLHYPLLILAHGIQKTALHGAGGPELVALVVAVLVIGSPILLRAYDEPMRRRIRQLRTPRPVASPVSA